MGFHSLDGASCGKQCPVTMLFYVPGQRRPKVTAQSPKVGARVWVDSEVTAFSTNLASVSLSKAPFICKILSRFLL